MVGWSLGENEHLQFREGVIKSLFGLVWPIGGGDRGGGQASLPPAGTTRKAT